MAYAMLRLTYSGAEDDEYKIIAVNHLIQLLEYFKLLLPFSVKKLVHLNDFKNEIVVDCHMNFE